MIRFGILGDGYIAERHKKAIEYVGGEIVFVYDPKYGKKQKFDIQIHKDIYIVICSPTYLHREQIKEFLKAPFVKIIVEKPMCLPWEHLIDDDRINIVLQLRYLPLPSSADLVKVIMIRGDEFWNSWKGNPRLTGGYMYEFFIHYVDLAIKLNADFSGLVLKEGKGERSIYYNNDYVLDITKHNMQNLYNKMYEDIIENKGIKPRDIFYLHWLLNRNSEKYGFSKNIIGKEVIIKKELL